MNDITADDFIPHQSQPKRKPTLRQIKFVNYYIESSNATQSAQLAGYKAKQMESFAALLLHKPYMQDLISKRKAEISKATEITIDKKAGLLWTLATRSMEAEDKEDIVIKAVAELNKMYGHYAPVQTNVQNVNIQTTLEDIRTARLEYKKDY